MIVQFAYDTLADKLATNPLTKAFLSKSVHMGRLPADERGHPILDAGSSLYLEVVFNGEGTGGDGLVHGQLEVVARLVVHQTATNRVGSGSRPRANRVALQASAVHRVLNRATGSDMPNFNGQFNQLQQQEMRQERIGETYYLVTQRYECHAVDNSGHALRGWDERELLSALLDVTCDDPTT